MLTSLHTRTFGQHEPMQTRAFMRTLDPMAAVVRAKSRVEGAQFDHKVHDVPHRVCNLANEVHRLK